MQRDNGFCGRKSRWSLSGEENRRSVSPKSFFKMILNNRNLLISIMAPAVCSLIPIYWDTNGGKEPYAAFTIALMAILWLFEAVPIAVTSFLPVVLFPLFGILPTEKITPVYLQDSILFLFGGCVIALSLEYCNFHTRIALNVIMTVGAKIPQLMLGIMFTTMFLSMFLNNTSTTAMMVPIVDAIMEELKSMIFLPWIASFTLIQKMIESSKASQNTKTVSNISIPEEQMNSPETQASTLQLTEDGRSDIDMANETNEDNQNSSSKDAIKREKKLNERIRNLKIMFLLATCYSSNIGGTGVITGSATNVVVISEVRKDADMANQDCRKLMEITFLDWMYFNVPPMILNTLFAWIYLQIHFLGLPDFLKFWKSKAKKDETKQFNKTLENSVKKAIRLKYEELGSIRFNEVGVLSLFVAIVFLWIFKDPKFMPGWDALPIFGRTESGKSFITECTPTLLICTLMFMIPGKMEYFQNFRNGGLGEGIRDTLLSYNFIEKKFPYGIFLLLGGGSAMAAGAKESGLNKWVQEFLESNETLQRLPDSMLLLVVLFLIAVITSVASNTACAAIVTPVLLGLSYAKKMHPLYMVYAAATVCSYAFVLPVSTPPNAIVYSSSDLKLSEMMKPGLLINVISIGILFVTTHTTSSWIFNFGGYNDQCNELANLGT